MKLKFISQIRKGNNQGTGFIALPQGKIVLFNLGDWVRVKVLKNKFFGKIIFYSGRLGVYVPKHIVRENKLMNKKVEIKVEKVDGFYAKIYPDGRIYIPQDIIRKQELKQNDIVLIKAIKDNKIIREKYSKLHLIVRAQRNQREYTCAFDKSLYGKEFTFKVEKLPKEIEKVKPSPAIANLLEKMEYGFIGKNSAIVFKGNKNPAIINMNVNFSDIALYLGAYFADGTRKGNSWAISASTFEQARYYLKMHNFLIKDSKPEFIISYTNIHNLRENEVKTNLATVWQKEVGIKINKFRIRKPTGKSISKQSEYGTLIIREHRQILLNVYNALLNLLIKEILTKRDKNLAFDFLCGVMEGDGCVPARKRGHIVIWTNKRDIHVLENILRVAEIEFKRITEKKSKYSLRIGALEILRNFPHLKDKIFALYPKRRKLFFERLKTVGAVKFLIGNHKSTNWVKSWLKNNGFCDENYEISEKGLKLRNELIENIENVFV
jgi:bifunctional DNA-binding transcriptional regulator/antitoxin component of YhaV-PrlF toxin-antitoxin module